MGGGGRLINFDCSNEGGEPFNGGGLKRVGRLNREIMVIVAQS